MDEILIRLIELIGAEMPELSLIDEDYGQFENQSESYPMTYPCVLIEQSESDWQEMNPLITTGRVQLSFRLFIDCYDDTHYGSGTTNLIAERYALCKKLYTLLQGRQIHDKMDYFTRASSKNYTTDAGIKIYEQTFRFDFVDESAL